MVYGLLGHPGSKAFNSQSFNI